MRVAGSGLPCGAALSLRVRRPDGSLAPSYPVSTDSAGAFAYRYPLTTASGAYRAEVVSAAGATLAAATFTGTYLANGRLWSSGFELNSTAPGVEWTTHAGSSPPAIQTAIVRSGAYALQAVPVADGGTRALVKQWLSTDAGANVYVRFYLRVGSLPPAETTLLALAAGDGTRRASIRLSSGGALRLFQDSPAGDTSIGAGSAALVLNTWYRVELHFNSLLSAGAQVLEARLDGAAFGATSTASLGPVSRLLLGIVSGGGTGSPTLYLDDVALNDGTATQTQNSWPGEGRILHLRPSADDPGNRGWTPSAGGGHYALVNEVAPDDGAGCLSAGAPAVDSFGLQGATGAIPAASGISLVQVGLRATAGGELSDVRGQLRLAAGTGAVTSGPTHDGQPGYATNDAVSYGGTGNYLLTSDRQPGSASPWTIAALDTARAGYGYLSGTGTISVTATWLLVEYVPPGVVTGRVSLQGSADAGGITISASGGASTLTGNGNPNFSLTLPPGTYVITATRPGYFPASRAAVEVLSGRATNLPAAIMHPGDATGDGALDTFDLVLIGANYGKTAGHDPRSDLNGDGVVNIFDLVMVAGNLGGGGVQRW